VLVPDAVVTVTGPDNAAAGTVARICVNAVTAAVGSVTPLNRTVAGLVKLPPVMMTSVPRGPWRVRAPSQRARSR
jgi:hypothetical protein